MNVEKVKEGVKLRIACDNLLNDNKQKTKVLKSLSIILSVVAIIICIGFGIYSELFAEDENIMILFIIGLSNFSLLCGNLYSFTQK